MIEINLGDPNVNENFKALEELQSTGMYTDAELQEIYNKQVDADKAKLNSMYGLCAKYPHIQRMEDEYAELCVRLDKLCKYYDESSGQLTDKQRDLMCKQITAMRSYADILQQRINYDIQYYSNENKG